MRRNSLVLCLALLLMSLAIAAPAADDASFSFDALDLPTGWKVVGDVTIDTKQGRDGSHAALRLAPKSRALLPLRESDGSGTVEMWVYDDRTIPASIDGRRGGPQWGVIDAKGQVLVLGNIYAPYLKGAQQITAAVYTPPKESPHVHVQYLATNRKPGWTRYTFSFDAKEGCTLLMDGKPIKRFDWDRTSFKGFTGVILLGDAVDGDDSQVLWVDDLDIKLGGPMEAAPTPPPPPPPVVPEQDPALDGKIVELLPEVRDQHPRLLFGPEDLPGLREKVKHPAMQGHWDAMLAYLKACIPPKASEVKFLGDATDGQRQGLWRMPTVALHYALTGDVDSRDRAIKYMEMLLELPTWERGSENNSGMSAANINIGAAICYDVLYHDLEPEFRETFRQRLIYQARAQYYGGHLNKNNATGYWQGDPANNHRWHRNAGMALAILTAYEGNPEEQWILNTVKEELDFICKWLPDDGTSHESPTYLTFGMPHLALTMQAADRCLGTAYLDLPFSKHVAAYKLQTITPDFNNGFQFGDSSGIGGYNSFVWLYTAHHRQGDVQAGFERVLAQNPKAFGTIEWCNILWKDPTLSGDIKNLPTTAYLPDLGLAFIRDRWGADGAAAMFKSSPFGGEVLNSYRNENNYRYINVAHDDPDANSFTLFRQGKFLAETDRYSKHKQSANHNTILVNGEGQMAKGRKEGTGWSQPATGAVDMKDMAKVMGYLEQDGVVIVEGEAGGSYEPIERFRRTFVWVEGGYVLVLDDIRAPSEVKISWLLQAPEITAVKAAPIHVKATDGLAQLDAPTADTGFANVYRYTLVNDGLSCPVQIAADRKQGGVISAGGADHRGNKLGWQQLRLDADVQTMRVVSIYDLWGRGDLRLAVTGNSAEAATVSIRGKDIADDWTWTRAKTDVIAGTLEGRVSFGPDNLPPEETSIVQD